MTAPVVSFVLIGRNEARHLASAIEALLQQGLARDEIEILYVDSGSTDDSVEAARGAGVDDVLALEAPHNAARARNRGLARVRAPFVHFVDGDTTLESGWAIEALRMLRADEGLVGVEGRLREAHAQSNIYQAVCELDWPATPGPVDFVGGNSLYRVEPLRAAGGFDERMELGEEPELGVRLRAAGGRLLRLDRPMGRHDLELRSLRDYLRQGFKSGLSCGMVVRATRAGLWRARRARLLLHASLLTAPLAAGALLLPLAPLAGLLLAGLAPLALLLLAGRKALAERRRGRATGLSIAYGLHSYLVKLPAAAGVLAADLHRLPRGGARSA